MNNEHLLLIGGGSFFGKAMASGIHRAITKYKYEPSLVVGNSIGSALGYDLATNGPDKMLHHAHSIDFTKAHTLFGMNYRPLTPKGNLNWSGFVSLAFKGCFVNQHITPIMKQIVSKNEHDDWVKSPKMGCVALSGDINAGVKYFSPLHQLDYGPALQAVEASARMQGYCKPLSLDKKSFCWDGGQFDHMGGVEYITKETKSVLCVWARPQDWKANWRDFRKVGFFGRLLRMIELNFIHKSMMDEYKINNECRKLGIKPRHIYMDRILRHPYDQDVDRMERQVQNAIYHTDKAFLIKS